MFSLLKLIIWIVGFVMVTAFVLSYFGYEVNFNYFSESKEECLKRLDECKNKYIKQGTKNAKCDFNCMSSDLIIKKEQ